MKTHWDTHDDMRSTNSRSVRLSACLIVRNEERHLAGCLASVAFCDEIIVVDSGSTDRTVEIARAAGATVVEQPWRGFAGQRNVALDAAHGDWVLEVDADERVTPQLRDEIIALVTDPPPGVDNAPIPRREVFLGVSLGPSALYPACGTRLFRRDRYRHDDRRAVHEGIWPAGRSAYPNGDLRHIPSGTLRESVRGVCHYSSLESTHLPEVSPVWAVILGIAIRPAVKFVYRVWLLGGWRDGRPGMIKITLDCAYDSLTWAFYLRDGRRSVNGDRPTDVAQSDGAVCNDDSNHFGRVPRYQGPVRIAAIARGTAQTVAAHEWLEQAANEGADVVLITDATPAAPRVRTVEIDRLGPLVVLRTLAWEEGRNPIEVLVYPGRRERASSRLLPGHLRGVVAPVSLQASPRDVIDSALALRQSV